MVFQSALDKELAFLYTAVIGSGLVHKSTSLIDLKNRISVLELKYCLLISLMLWTTRGQSENQQIYFNFKIMDIFFIRNVFLRFDCTFNSFLIIVLSILFYCYSLFYWIVILYPQMQFVICLCLKKYQKKNTNKYHYTLVQTNYCFCASLSWKPINQCLFTRDQAIRSPWPLSEEAAISG